MDRKKVSVGGQAVIEGVMMKGPKALATAVRRPTGEIVYKVTKLKPSMNFLTKIPFIRGGAILFETLILGTKELSFSANEAGEEEEKLGDKELMITVIAALALGIGLFMVLPSILSSFMFKNNRMNANIFEGILRILFFLIYIKAISFSKEIKRVFEYHGAEHKCIYAFENNEELVKESAVKYTTLHPRCGTSFLLIVMIISIVVFSSLDFMIPQPDNMWMKVGLKAVLRIVFMPLVAGLAYEFQKYSSKHLDNPLYKMIAIPGLSLQKITTKEPDLEQLEVSMVALRVALGLEVDNATEVFEK
ncbi:MULTISPECIES: DUF1385 domain-containing protein [Psychrilyobacter]|uniref:DUF1385 domain-containing protein n=1 Tax=Psychrilyobacter piezotolerans TaxID=2293438 RepID=A0ABX9KKL8_9FUSO|nr:MULTISPECIES: DUF1385 domain-containing protein [Psychrilyobacter]MCS5421030.1 DUF1385 domain-containing protein [Psychrilyobacter sp. S5]NDI76309.1 DUF1385 domain-containing protein [Psychrilyobacter piezotolerans]RDE65908.1 DUF1385 domain-containing protein [Psychrilyobacter sp. S5]REI43086.1 DUF1385 domain-containing protein [Psychrilyobacter piezotolerans]